MAKKVDEIRGEENKRKLLEALAGLGYEFEESCSAKDLSSAVEGYTDERTAGIIDNFAVIPDAEEIALRRPGENMYNIYLKKR